MSAQHKIIILGTGPCGLGAAWRLKEKGFEDFILLEAESHPGGLASSFKDELGFTWDVGGHVQFSHYEDFDRVMDLALPDGWLHHQRESWVWIKNRFVPYPFQNNLWRLPEEDQKKCVEGLEKSQKTSPSTPQNFGEWVSASFGEGLSDLFMRPYNFKVWAHPLELMNYQWIGERVATVDLQKVRANIAAQKDEVSWGPNATFRFPKEGGTGAIWKSVARLIGEEKIKYKSCVTKIDVEKRCLQLESGEEFSYETMVSAIPLDRLCALTKVPLRGELLSSDSHIVGIGLKGQPPEELCTKCWMYFPENDCPFYRVTVFSNYSPANVPDPKTTWSLMCETSSSPHKPVNVNTVLEETIQGLIRTKLIRSLDEIISKWRITASPGYPTPSLQRDEIVHDALHRLSGYGIFSRGRFGAWKYEVSNQDHTFMQGFEWADWFLEGREEETFRHPSRANAPGKRPLRA